MSQLITKARPRRSPNRVRLVNLDGSPARPSAESWPAWTDAHFWEPTRDEVIGTDSMGAEVYQSDCRPEPRDETAAEFMARIASEEAAELARVEAAYQPLPEDLEEYQLWAEALDAGRLTGDSAKRFTFGCYGVGEPFGHDAVMTGQISEDELAMVAAGMAI